MKKKKRRSTRSLSWVFKPVLFLTFVLLVYAVTIILHGTFTDYKPEEKTVLTPLSKSELATVDEDTLSFMIWNVGYAGLGASSDFFFQGGGFFIDGGKMIRPPQESVEKNIEAGQRFIRTNPADFYLFQELDINSKRSYFINQFQAFQDQLPDYEAQFGKNLEVARIPAPILQPWSAYGKATSGLGTFSKYQSQESTRFQLPGKLGWPNRLFLLDRCVLSSRYALADGKDLVVMNIHNDAYDKNGDLKGQQLDYVKDLAKAEYEKGNYVVLGGDWNMCPPYFKVDGFMKGGMDKRKQYNIPDDLFTEGWNWIYDPTEPTNRKTDEKYVAGKTFVTIIDFYLLSPNLKAVQVKTVDQAFEFSDHQPVYLKVALL